MRLSRVVRTTAAAVMITGVTLPLVRRRARLHPAAVVAGAASAPLALCLLVPRSRARDVGVCTLQMWAYLAAYKMPHDDPQKLRARVRVDYPIVVDRFLGAGELPTVRMQRALHREGSYRRWEVVLVWAHWLWFLVPHGTLAYILLRHRERFARSAVITYAVFDIGAAFYWLIPTAPPWYAAELGSFGEAGEHDALAVRRLMAEYGEHYWGTRWDALYSVFGGNPLAAMPSLHLATSAIAATMLAETGTGAGVLGWTYTATLGFSLVYLGEHYVADLLAGATLAGGIYALAKPSRPVLAGVSRVVRGAERAILGSDAEGLGRV